MNPSTTSTSDHVVLRRLTRVALALLSALAFAGPARCGSLDEAYPRAKAEASRHLSNVKLSYVAATPAFAADGARTGDVWFNFTGVGRAGKPMLVSVTLKPDDRIVYDPVSDAPREDRFGHHTKPPLNISHWMAAEVALAMALKHHTFHPPKDGVSLAIRRSQEYGNGPIMKLYWTSGDWIVHVVFEPRTGSILDAGKTHKSKVHVIQFQPR